MAVEHHAEEGGRGTEDMDLVGDSLDDPAKRTSGRGSSKKSSSVIGRTVLLIAGVLVITGIWSMRKSNRPQAPKQEDLVPTRDFSEGSVLQIGYVGRPEDINVIWRRQDFFIPNPTQATVKKAARQYTIKDGLFVEMLIEEGEHAGKTVLVEEHDLDLGWIDRNSKLNDDAAGSFVCLMVFIMLLACLILYTRKRLLYETTKFDVEVDQIRATNRSLFNEMDEVVEYNKRAYDENQSILKELIRYQALRHVEIEVAPISWTARDVKLIEGP
jgi:hypothetical protein